MRFSVEEVAYKFGTEVITRNFEKKKNTSKKGKGNIDGKETQQVIVEMKRYWKEVLVEGRGASRIFVCKEEREEVLDKKLLQNYTNCGRGQMIYRKSLEELILSYLKYGRRKFDTITSRRLAYEIGAITTEMYQMSRLIGHDEKGKYHKKMTEIQAFKDVNYNLIYDVVNKETERIVSNIEKILTDLHRKKNIYYVPVTNGVIDSKDMKLEEHEPLLPTLVDEIINKQRQLREKHNVEFEDLRFKLKDEFVKAYKREEWEYLRTLGYTRIYNTNLVSLIAWDKEIENYFEKRTELKEVFMLEHREFAIDKAKNRNEDFFNKPVRVKKTIKLFGGKPKWKTNDSEYDKLFGTNKLEHDYMIQLKFSKLYAKEFGELLKLLQEFKPIEN